MQAQILDLLEQQQKERHMAMILVSHDPEFVRALQPDRVLTMPDGTVDHFSDEMLDLVELA